MLEGYCIFVIIVGVKVYFFETVSVHFVGKDLKMRTGNDI